MGRNVSEFGAFLKRKRLEQGWSLREFCRRCGYDVGNVSKYERGVMRPPQSRTVLEKLARDVGLKSATEDWTTFMDLAAISAGRIPDRVMDDAELVKSLPLVFRTVTGRRLSAEKLRQLAEVIRRT